MVPGQRAGSGKAAAGFRSPRPSAGWFGGIGRPYRPRDDVVGVDLGRLPQAGIGCPFGPREWREWRV